MTTKKGKAGKKVAVGAVIFGSGIIMALTLYGIIYGTSDLKAYVTQISLPIIIGLTFAGASLVFDAAFE